jgi:hypothetical protein
MTDPTPTPQQAFYAVNLLVLNAAAAEVGRIAATRALFFG